MIFVVVGEDFLHFCSSAKKIHRACTAPPDVKTSQPRLREGRRMQKMGQAKADVAFMEDMRAMGVSGSGTHDEIRSVASDRARWRQLVAQCPSRDRRT